VSGEREIRESGCRVSGGTGHQKKTKIKMQKAKLQSKIQNGLFNARGVWRNASPRSFDFGWDRRRRLNYTGECYV
jgi:hypothetical protein